MQDRGYSVRLRTLQGEVGNLTLLSSAVREGILYSVRLRSAVRKRGYSTQLHLSVKIG